MVKINWEKVHPNAVKASTHSFESWLDLIIWDLLEIQEASEELNETLLDQELQHLFDILKNDIEILENHAEGKPKVFFLEYSNNTMLKLVGYIYETTELLRGAEFFKILEPIKKIEEAINEYITHTENSLNGFNWAWEKWNSLSKEQKNELLHDLPLYRENNSKMNNFIIPQTQSSIIASINNNEIHELGRIDIPYSSKTVITENGFIVALCFGAKSKSTRLKIFDMSGKQLLRLPQYKYRSIACKNNVVYLGGQYGTREKELFAYIDLSNVDFSINEMQLPIKTVKGKSIDDILIRDNMLYLVDNIVYPKYIFHYDISTPENPVHIATKKLPNNGTYEHIIKGEISKNWMVLYSRNVGMRGEFQHITINGKKETVLSFHIASMREDKIEKRFLDISLFNDKLVILYDDCVKIMNLNNTISKEQLLASTSIQKIESMNKLLKISDNHCLLVGNTQYELLQLNRGNKQ